MVYSKKLLPAALSLTLALGAAAPAALALEGAQDVTLTFPAAQSDALLHKGETYSLRSWAERVDDPNYYDKSAPTDLTADVYHLPLGSSFTVSFNGVQQNRCGMYFWSDPDGDSVYDQLIYCFDGLDYDPDPMPLDTQGPVTAPDEGCLCTRSTPMSDNTVDVLGMSHFDLDKATFTAAGLLKLYGPNTLVKLELENEVDGDYITDSYYFLVDGQPAGDGLLTIPKGMALSAQGALVSPWAVETISAAETSGVIPDALLGGDLTGSMTRAQFADAVNTLYAAMGGTLPEIYALEFPPFQDMPSDGGIPIRIAYTLGFVNGTSDTTFSPEGTLTREQAVTMLSRVFTKLGGQLPAATGTGFADNGQISGWAMPAVAFMSDSKVVGGVSGNRFAPKSFLTAQQALIMAQRMFENLK